MANHAVAKVVELVGSSMKGWSEAAVQVEAMTA